jgi:hypothetical protein
VSLRPYEGEPVGIEITPVNGRPRWRLAYCYGCSDGYRGGKAAAERWAAKHLAEMHEDETR